MSEPTQPIMIRYNDTLEYEYITCFSTYGVFTGARIDYESLPQGFNSYYILEGKDGIVSKILPARITNAKRDVFGTFIAKEKLGGLAGRLGTSIDWERDMTIHTDQSFDFEEYFGTKPSIDCQIADAYRRQEIQIKEAKAKKRGKGNTQEHRPNRDR